MDYNGAREAEAIIEKVKDWRERCVDAILSLSSRLDDVEEQANSLGSSSQERLEDFDSTYQALSSATDSVELILGEYETLKPAFDIISEANFDAIDSENTRARSTGTASECFKFLLEIASSMSRELLESNPVEGLPFTASQIKPIRDWFTFESEKIATCINKGMIAEIDEEAKVEYIRTRRYLSEFQKRGDVPEGDNGQPESANRANSQKIILPKSDDVVELIRRLVNKPDGMSDNEVARQFVEKTGANWRSLLSQARKKKFKPLWDSLTSD